MNISIRFNEIAENILVSDTSSVTRVRLRSELRKALGDLTLGLKQLKSPYKVVSEKRGPHVDYEFTVAFSEDAIKTIAQWPLTGMYSHLGQRTPCEHLASYLNDHFKNKNKGWPLTNAHIYCEHLEM